MGAIKCVKKIRYTKKIAVADNALIDVAGAINFSRRH